MTKENSINFKILIKALILFVVVFIFSQMILTHVVSAQSSGESEYVISDADIASELKRAEILIGTDSGINLNANITRNEMVVLLTRLLGKESATNSYKTYSVPFSDIDLWASKYIRYAYASGLSNGIATNKFGGQNKVTLEEAETFLLRAIGYSSGVDFDWNSPRLLSKSLGIEDNLSLTSSKLITRKELNRMVFNTLNANIKGKDKLLKETLSFYNGSNSNSNNNSNNNSNSNSNNDQDEEEITIDNKEEISSEIKEENEVIAGDNNASSEKYIIGYLPTWTGNYYKTFDYSKVTHINIAFVNPDETGNLSSNFDGDKLKEIVNLAHKSGAKVLISLGGAGYGENYLNLTSNKTKINDFTTKIMEYVEAYNLDGVDLDIEGDVNKAFWNNYESFVSVLKSKCKEKDVLLTTAVGKWYASYITNNTFKHFDLVNIMAYDNDLDKNNHSTYDYAKECLSYFEKRGIDKDKLLLGVPFYGYEYDSSGKLKWKTAKSYMQILSLNSNAKYYDSSLGYSYNGETTIKKKCELSKEYKGIMIWCLNQDATGSNSLLSLINNCIRY